ncbi:hypothetical protein AALP_AAs68065U000100 [Arabis alpina]|uniref:DUF4283 domain-containing protein n=1 Tax=Arabis alpina TaxID=50452 RepID=A0A087FYA7_ARAAL|nr:hypothetical protein AALP_AAs68065U000100 [Arabis alpina]
MTKPPKKRPKEPSFSPTKSLDPLSSSVALPAESISLISEGLSSEPPLELAPAALSPSVVSDLVDPVVLVPSKPQPTTVKAVSAAVPEDHQVGNVVSSAQISQAEPNSTVKPTIVGAPVNSEPQAKTPMDSWANLFSGSSKELEKKGEAFTLPSGEACVTIPNSVIEKNRKSWECFILGQFYHDPPSQGKIHNIVNGIWSRNFRDVTVSKMEGNAFLFRIPNSATRNRVLKQRLWEIDGQTMFVANWELGVIPTKPELTSAPIWLELRHVPYQFFNEEGLEHIAGLVGHPKFLHPSTANKTNLEVAKVFTFIDPRKPLPEAVNVRFETGEIDRVLVSSPWMPPICSHCKEVGHGLKRCTLAPVLCSACNSKTHDAETCQQKTDPSLTTSSSRRGKAKLKSGLLHVDVLVDKNGESESLTSIVIPPGQSLLGKASDVTPVNHF